MSQNPFKVVPTKSFLKDLKSVQSKVPPAQSKRIYKAIQGLEQNPHQGKKLVGIQSGVWRIRIGDYRIRYDIEGSTVILHTIRHRKDVYKKIH